MSDSFEVETMTLRRWLTHRTVATDELREELACWLARMSDSPAQAAAALGDATRKVQQESNDRAVAQLHNAISKPE